VPLLGALLSRSSSGSPSILFRRVTELQTVFVPPAMLFRWPSVQSGGYPTLADPANWKNQMTNRSVFGTGSRSEVALHIR